MLGSSFRGRGLFLGSVVLVAAMLGLDAAPKPDVFKLETPLAKLPPGAAALTLRVSPNGQRVAYMAKLKGGGEAVFIDDKQGPAYSGIVNHSLSFSPDSNRVAYGAITKEKAVVVVDGREYAAFHQSADGMPIWSPDSRHFAFFAKTEEDRVVVVVDGTPGQTWDLAIPDSFLFSPDSSHFAYAVKDGESGRVVVDGDPSPRHRNVAGLTFSPDGRHFAYVAMREYSMSIVVDGIEMATATNFIKDTLRFDSARQLHVISMEGDRLARIEIDLIGRPTGESTGAFDPDPANQKNQTSP